MSRAIYVTVTCLTTGLAVSGCATAPVQTAAGYASAGAHGAYGVASAGAHGAYGVASTGAQVVYTTGGDVYSGVGQAAKQPLRDLNMMQDPIPAALLRTESKPYDLAGVTSCEAVLDQVAELDLALGPDLDAPKDRGRNRTTRGADAAASAALLAAADAADHFIPMRSMIKEVSGATRYEKHVKHAVLAGTVRRAFLKAIGMSHNCGWPASPLVFNAAQVAVTSAAWTSPTASGLQALAIATPAPLSAPPLPVYRASVSVASATPVVRSVAYAAPVATSSSRLGTTTSTVVAQGAPRAVSRVSMASASPVAASPSAQRAYTPRAIDVSTVEPGEAPSSDASGAYAPSAYSSSSSPSAFVSSASPPAPWSAPNPSRP